VKLAVRDEVLRFARPGETSYGTLRERSLLIVEVTGADGVTGRGEAAPLTAYDGVDLESVRAALEAYRPILEATEDADEAIAACVGARDLPQALAAVDLALRDLDGRRTGTPVAQLLSPTPAATIEVNATIAAREPGDAAQAAAAAVRAGYRTLKIKVGGGDDVQRVAAVRAAAGPDVALRLDANGAWSVAEAARAIERLVPFGIEYVEEPAHGVEELRAVRERSGVPIAMDETGVEPGAISAGAVDAVCLKLSRSGGIGALLEQAADARGAGAHVYLASTFDGRLGIAGALHAAAVLAPLPACGLGTLELFDVDPAPLRASGGRLVVPVGPGLGVEP
jgi:o-succinylbenzoate synthase